MNVVGAVMHGGVAVAIVQVEFTGDEFELAAGEGLGNVCHAVIDRNACAAQQVFYGERDPHARVFDEFEGFVEDAFDQRVVEQREFRLHRRKGLVEMQLGTSWAPATWFRASGRDVASNVSTTASARGLG